MTKRIHWPALAVLFVLTLPTGVADAQTVIPGGSVSNQTWTLVNSPYLLQGDVTIPPGASLTIEAGVEVQIADTDGLGATPDTERIALVVDGAIDVQGTATQPVRFVPDTGTTSAGQNQKHWYGIVVSATATQAHFTHVDVQNARSGLKSYSSGAALKINHATFRNCDRRGMLLEDTGTPTLNGITVVDNSGDGITIHSPSDLLLQNILMVNNGVGMVTEVSSDSGGNHSLVNATIHNNLDWGVAAFVFTGGVSGGLNIVNSIVTRNGKYGVEADSGTTVAISYSNIWDNDDGSTIGVDEGNGLIAANPLFKSVPTDFGLRASSPGIDTGTTTMAPSTDLDGHQRPVDGDGVGGASYDMGAYEFGADVVCGDGVLDPGEDCDDGNAVGGDGCSAQCAIEGTTDAGPSTPDAGVVPDTGVVPDSGVFPDTGVPDTGVVPDTGTPDSDVGVGNRPDATSPADGGSERADADGPSDVDSPDIGPTADSASVDANAGQGQHRESSGCSTAPARPSPGTLAWMAWMFVVVGGQRWLRRARRRAN